LDAATVAFSILWVIESSSLNQCVAAEASFRWSR
jgi:hypothetical protein